jgi:mono/diheme cytochrome c family protein
MSRATVLTALAMAASQAGCGYAGGAPHADGQALFAQDCEVCHSLTGHESPVRQGGDLLGLRVSRGAMLQFVGEMPVRHPLSSAQVRTVTDYVLAVEARERHPR